MDHAKMKGAPEAANLATCFQARDGLAIQAAGMDVAMEKAVLVFT